MPKLHENSHRSNEESRKGFPTDHTGNMIASPMNAFPAPTASYMGFLSPSDSSFSANHRYWSSNPQIPSFEQQASHEKNRYGCNNSKIDISDVKKTLKSLEHICTLTSLDDTAYLLFTEYELSLEGLKLSPPRSKKIRCKQTNVPLAHIDAVQMKMELQRKQKPMRGD
ncbi:uncharacterized protein RHIMIDRAFT_241012 [Rhizopus microsporus ATCC 52813]|uniref:Uncharacterized protein n=1 Tax=Rhizopus microsporus ATCC 52813 TaxID=1340429 RepID=A0A2G4SK35_RHIZD|nr:uncharacterized protein RHIMIDRAFT_241012 [Rhizopus microsporus ATCC 52813]PHZ09134.1 hypothetical protein RHIMIDRAFT_241012 [Rhizopus microsporus ATCC 52813]